MTNEEIAFCEQQFLNPEVSRVDAWQIGEALAYLNLAEMPMPMEEWEWEVKSELRRDLRLNEAWAPDVDFRFGLIS